MALYFFRVAAWLRQQQEEGWRGVLAEVHAGDLGAGAECLNKNIDKMEQNMNHDKTC